MRTSDIHAIDLFCGAGGLTSGLRTAGVKVEAGVDIDGDCKHAYEFNNGSKFLSRSVARLSGEQLQAYIPKGKMSLLAGCAPCQPFSKYTQGRDATADPKWKLLRHFTRLIEEMNPDFVTMENVATLTRHTVFDRFQSSLIRMGYQVDCKVLSCDDYGLPQTRNRLVLIASRHGDIKLPLPPKKRKTVRDVIGRLPAIAAGQSHPSDRLHKASQLSPLNLRRIRASTPGGTWRDWPVSLRAKCHTRESGFSYPSVYGRMEWDEPAPTMTTLCYGFGNGRFGHPEQDRAISLREASIIQSFPADYSFVPEGDTVITRNIGRMIGNAVPPLIGEIVGKSIIAHANSISR